MVGPRWRYSSVLVCLFQRAVQLGVVLQLIGVSQPNLYKPAGRQFQRLLRKT